MIIPPKHMCGLCCTAFCLPLSPRELLRAADAQVGFRKQGKWPKKNVKQYNDIEKIADLVLYIGERVYNQITGQEYNKIEHVYRCRHVTNEGKCGIYEERPHMCVIYRNCEYKGYCESIWCDYHKSKVVGKSEEKEIFEYAPKDMNTDPKDFGLLQHYLKQQELGAPL